MYLEKIKSPKDIKNFNEDQLTILGNEIREKIIYTVAQNGGHLASNLGIVELTLALHRVFNTPEDKIVFDVGHQCYVHKLITGRYEQFDTIRQFNGLSGFPKRQESSHDCFETGHASTSISAALGLARARDIRGDKEQVVAVIGDGALTGGMCYEALNDAGSSQTPLIVVLNDNEMSISKNVGALANYLTHLRVSKKWNKTKKAVKSGLSKIPLIGKPVSKTMEWGKNFLKGMVIDESFFEALGFNYLGPIDGHDIKIMEYVLNNAKELKKPVIIHCITKKGYGYEQAEIDPEIFHGANPFIVDSGEAVEVHHVKSASQVAGEKLASLAEENPQIVAITAAMPIGTGMSIFQQTFPQRFMDVGIAEGHAVTLAAGLAAGGLHPYVAIYSTFLQRGYDQILHDVALQNLSVCFLLDRAGIAGADGETHHGIYDLAYLQSMPNVAIFAPKDLKELKKIMEYSQWHQGPCAIRYPRSLSKQIEEKKEQKFIPGVWERLAEGKDGVILAVGSMVETALKASKTIKEEYHKNVAVVNASSVRPLDEEILLAFKNSPIITIEEHVLQGGFASAVEGFYGEKQEPVRLLPLAINQILPHGSRKDLLTMAQLDVVTVVSRISDFIEKSKS